MKVKFPDWSPTAILILVPAIISVVVGVTVANDVRQVSLAETELLSKGSRAIGTVIDKTTLQSGSEDDSYMITYTFSPPNGEQLTAGWLINKPAWDKLYIGSPIEIAFDPAYPSRNLPVEAEATPLWFIPLAAIVFAFLSFVVSFVLLLLVMTLIERLVNKLVPFHKKGAS
jgi:hypothetical protein